MKYVIALLVALLGLSGLAPVPARAATDTRQITVYKDPECTCCEGYAAYLKSNGFQVKIVNTHDLPLMNEQHGVPTDLQGCHFSVIGDYFVGGHVPVAVINRLLTEKPQIDGITLAGMPQGSPGMYGKKTAPFKIYAITKGASALYASE